MKVNVILLIVTALALRESWLLIPESESTFDPYPFYEAQVQRQYYFYFAFYYASNLLFVYAFLQVADRFHSFFHVWFLLQLVELIDYFLTYNTAWFMVGKISIGITLVKLVSLITLALILCLKTFQTRQ